MAPSTPAPTSRGSQATGAVSTRWRGVRRLPSLLALAALAVVAAGCGAVHHMGPHAGNPVAGKALFESTCSSCHTLAAAGTTGTIGPNLDFAFGPDRCQGFSQSTIQDVVRGQIAYADPDPEVDWPPDSTDAVVGMPPGLLNGQKAKDVAAYVASVAGVTHGPGKHFDCQTGSYSG